MYVNTAQQHFYAWQPASTQQFFLVSIFFLPIFCFLWLVRIVQYFGTGLFIVLDVYVPVEEVSVYVHKTYIQHT